MDTSKKEFQLPNKYFCHKCNQELYSCPDPCCQGIMHHKEWKDCDEDVFYIGAIRLTPFEQLEQDINRAIAETLEKYKTRDLPGLEFVDAKITGLIQHQGHPETGVGVEFKIGKDSRKSE